MAARPIPDEDLDAALEAYEQAGHVKADAARLLGIDRCTFVHRLNRAQQSKQRAAGGARQDTRTDDAERRILRARLSDAIARLREAEERLLAHEMLADTISGADPPDWKIERTKRGGTESTACAVASDWHAGEYVDPATVGGRNKFDLETLERRARRFFEQVIRLTEINRTHTRIDNLVLFMLGDFINNFLHFESVESNTLAPPEEVLRVYELILAGIRLLLNEGKFKRILLPCKAGNHGRTTQKPVVATFSRTNLETMLYGFLRAAFAENDRLEWHISPAYLDYLPIYDKVVRFHHGHAIRYKGGVGGFFVPLGQRTKAWNETQHADLDVMAHLHSYQALSHVVINGSLVGYNPFAQDRISARWEPPTHAFWLFHPTRHFRTCDWPIDLEPVEEK